MGRDSQVSNVLQYCFCVIKVENGKQGGTPYGFIYNEENVQKPNNGI